MDPGIILINNAVRVMDIPFTIDNDMITIQGTDEFAFDQEAIAIIRALDLSSGQIKTDKSFCSVYRHSATEILFTWLTYPTQKSRIEKHEKHERHPIDKILENEQLQCTHVRFKYVISDGKTAGLDANDYLQEYRKWTCYYNSDSDSDSESESSFRTHEYIRFVEASPIVYTWKKETAHIIQQMVSFIISVYETPKYNINDTFAISYYKVSDDTIMCSVVCFHPWKRIIF
jgi:hypothetical protein